MADLGKKISELQETTDLAGLYTIGTDKNQQSKKVSLQFLKEAADFANAQGDYAKEVGDTVAGNVGVNAYPTFSASTQYAAGSVVNYNGKLYRFTSLHPAGAWVGTDAVLTSIKAEADLKLTELESYVGDSVETTRNLFDGSVINGIYADSNTTIKANSSTSCAIVPCKPNTRYVISRKVLGKRFAVFYTKEYPNIGTAVFGFDSNNNAEAIGISTGEGASFVVIWLYGAVVDSLSLSEIVKGLQVEEGSERTSFIPHFSLVDHTLREQMSTYQEDVDNSNEAFKEEVGGELSDAILRIDNALNDATKKINDDLEETHSKIDIKFNALESSVITQVAQLEEKVERNQSIGNGNAAKIESLEVNKANESEFKEFKEQVNILNEGGLNLKDSLLRDAINTWLNAHPEATTTVLDNSLTLDKFKISAMPFVTPEMFGAIGDGVTDDTAAIRQACLCGVKTVIFSKKYAINIEQGTAPHENRVFFVCECDNLIGLSGVIKLGDNDNGNVADNKGFESIFSFSGKDKNRKIYVDGLTFDFNYSQNPIHQATSNNVGVEVNGQQMAINAWNISELIVKNCVFIEHSGTNCVTYRSDGLSDITPYVEVSSCTFVGIGKKSIYNGGDAYHDCSTVGIHCGTNTDDVLSQKTTAVVKDNSFDGAGGNAFDACECSAYRFTFENNIVRNYAIGVMPLVCYSNTKASISNNVFNNVGVGVSVWNRANDITLSDGIVGMERLDINSNSFLINIPKWIKTPTFSTINNKEGEYYKGTIYGCVRSTGGWRYSMGSFNFVGNSVDFVDVAELPESAYSSVYSGGCINLYLNYDGSPSRNMECNSFKIQNNRFSNLPSYLLILMPFNHIGELHITDNSLINSHRRQNAAIKNDGLIAVKLNKYANLLQSFKLLEIYRNFIDYAYTKKDYGTVWGRISVNNSELYSVCKVQDNISRLPYYGSIQIDDNSFTEVVT